MFRYIGSPLGFFFSTLTLSQAQLRAQLIKANTISYNSHLTLHKGINYEGLTNIAFEAQPHSTQAEHLRIDFQGKEVKQLLVNNEILKDPASLYREGQICIPSRYLKWGEKNNITIQYKNQYDQDGNGCVSFIDTDQKQYLYTQFEPYYANQVFPLFDQPNLKAPFALTIACPSEWQAVLSNQFPNNDQNSKPAGIPQQYQKLYQSLRTTYGKSIPEGYKTSRFNPTLPLSTYLYCFVVGPYKQMVINKNPKNKNLDIPMRLYSIESLYPEMERLAPYIEEITVESMDFFQKYFGYKYPFSKYDQVFAHEYKWGAMENAGIVTFNDLYLFKDKVSNEKMLSFGNTIVHELSHHWFGNLVTMKWWDDLWLNQSFAQYISHYCLEQMKKGLKTISYESAMLSFFTRKNWGYAEDELVTTHPIRGQVVDTFTAESIFDGITYSKGAATMKQLMYLIGQQSFSKALATYFKKHEFNNAILDDLLAAIQPFFDKEKNGLTLDEWKKMWLETAGTNKLLCQWQPGNDSAVVIQSKDRNQCPTLRLHRIKIAIISKNHEITTKQVTILPQQRTKINLPITYDTVAILLNYDDYTFAKVELDSRSRTYFQQNLHRLKDSVSRCLIWKSYFDMVKTCGITSSEFTSFCIQNLENERSDPIFQDQLTKLMTAISLYTPKSHRQSLYQDSFEFLNKLLLSLPENQATANRKVIIKDKLIDFCRTKLHADILFNWYHNKHAPYSNQELNNSLRWKIVVKIFSRSEFNKEQKWSLFQDMKSRDSSDVMINKKITCEALSASPEELSRLYQGFFRKKQKRSLTNYVHQLGGFNHQIHADVIKEKYVSRYFDDLKRFLGGNVTQEQKWFASGDYLESFLTYFDPVIEGTKEELIAKIEGFKEITTKNEKIKRLILKKIDVLERRIKVYEYFSSQKK